MKTKHHQMLIKSERNQGHHNDVFVNRKIAWMKEKAKPQKQMPMLLNCADSHISASQVAL